MNQNKIKIILSVLRVLETLYLLTFLYILYLSTLPYEDARELVTDWVTVSYFILPILLLKNVIVAMFNKGVLTQRQKIYLLVRCALYVLLTVISYPIIN